MGTSEKKHPTGESAPGFLKPWKNIRNQLDSKCFVLRLQPAVAEYVQVWNSLGSMVGSKVPLKGGWDRWQKKSPNWQEFFTTSIHPRKLTWHVKMGAPWKRRSLLETINSRFHLEDHPT